MKQAGFNRLVARLQSLQSVAIAFSGGVDSTLLLAAAQEVLGEQVMGFTVVTPYMERREIADALALARKLGVSHQLIETDMSKNLRNNPEERCYFCKRHLFTKLLERAKAAGFLQVLEGSNLDDVEHHASGLQALRELKVISPFIEAGLTKAQIRQLSRERNLPTAEKPSHACLLTRLPIGEWVAMEDLQRIEEAECLLREKEYAQVRVRLHGRLARIEVDPAQRERLLDEAPDVIQALEGLGFRYVTLDLRGYQAGSMSPVPG